jgi:hypothetical protein
MSHRLLLSAALGLGLMALPAHAFLARNNLVVVAEGGQTFNIPFRGKSGASEFWCAAGDYVQNFLGLPGSTRIWRLSEPPRRRGEGVRFSLSPEGAASSTGLAMFGSGPPGSITASMALNICPPLSNRFGRN